MSQFLKMLQLAAQPMNLQIGAIDIGPGLCQFVEELSDPDPQLVAIFDPDQSAAFQHLLALTKS